MSDVVVRPAQEADLAALVDAFADEDFFIDRLARQSAGDGVLLTAWVGNAPIGVVYLWLDPTEEPEVREHLPDVPFLNRVEVLAEHRNRGVGNALMLAAEERLAACGYDQVALAVRIDNVDAHRLFKRLKYKQWPHGPVVCMSVVKLADGSRKNSPETCNMLVKHLPDSNA
jgi:GNAT superfamily N-acetyltransferase